MRRRPERRTAWQIKTSSANHLEKKKKQVRSERAWNLNHSGQGVCGEEEGGEMVGPVPLGNIEDVAEEEQITQVIIL